MGTIWSQPRRALHTFFFIQKSSTNYLVSDLLTWRNVNKTNVFMCQIMQFRLIPFIYNTGISLMQDRTICMSRGAPNFNLEGSKVNLISIWQLDVTRGFTVGRYHTFTCWYILLYFPWSSHMISMNMGIHWNRRKKVYL